VIAAKVPAINRELSWGSAKRPGANVIEAVNAVPAKMDTLRGSLLPAGVEVSVPRDFGQTGTEKRNELLLDM